MPAADINAATIHPARLFLRNELSRDPI